MWHSCEARQTVSMETAHCQGLFQYHHTKEWKILFPVHAQKIRNNLSWEKIQSLELKNIFEWWDYFPFNTTSIDRCVMCYFVLQLHRNWATCFLGIKATEDFQRSSSVKTSDKGPVCNYLLQTFGFQVRGLDLSGFKHEHETSLPVDQRTWEVLTFWLWTPWTLILLPVVCETIRAIGPLVSWELLRSVVCRDDKKRTPLLTTTQVQPWPKMAQKLDPRGGWKEWNKQIHNTQKIWWNNF